eukprot:gene1483-2108_t
MEEGVVVVGTEMGDWEGREMAGMGQEDLEGLVVKDEGEVIVARSKHDLKKHHEWFRVIEKMVVEAALGSWIAKSVMRSVPLLGSWKLKVVMVCSKELGDTEVVVEALGDRDKVPMRVGYGELQGENNWLHL